MIQCDFQHHPVVFLDIDGVLNHIGCKEETDFLPEAIQVLNELNKRNCWFVLHSSWRTAFPLRLIEQELLKHGFQGFLLDKTVEYIGKPELKSFTWNSLEEMETHPIEEEILQYIRLYDIKQFLILDDLPFQTPLLSKHQVQTSYFDPQNGGLSIRHLEQCLKILEKKEENH